MERRVKTQLNFFKEFRGLIFNKKEIFIKNTKKQEFQEKKQTIIQTELVKKFAIYPIKDSLDYPNWKKSVTPLLEVMQQGGGILNASALLAQVKSSVQCQKIRYLTEAALDIYNLMEIVEKHLFSVKAINECARQKIASHRIKFHAASNPRTINSCLEARKIINFLKINNLVEKADTFLIKALQNYVLPSNLQEILDSKLHEISLTNKQSIINEGHSLIGSIQSYRNMAQILYTEKNKFERESGNAINREISPNDLLDILICHYDSLIHHLIQKKIK